MNENPPDSLPYSSEEPLVGEGNGAVYRAALEVTWFSPNKQQVDAAAFYRRKGVDDDGISKALRHIRIGRILRSLSTA